MEEPGELQSMGLQTVGNDLAIAFGELTKGERRGHHVPVREKINTDDLAILVNC